MGEGEPVQEYVIVVGFTLKRLKAVKETRLFQLIINVVLILIFINSSTEEIFSILGYYNFLVPLMIIIFLGVGGQSIVIGATDSLPGLTAELIDTEGVHQKQNRVESLKTRFQDTYIFVILMIFGIVMFVLSWLVS